MKGKNVWVIVSVVTLLLMGVGIAGATPFPQPPSPAAVAATVAGGISYQGRLTDPGGTPLNGTYAMRFIVYDDEAAGTALWDSGTVDVTVESGLFNVVLGVDQSDFNGQALWLSITVSGETLSPRQEILPAPYALSLRPGADVVGENIGATDAVFSGYAPATGTALYADANGGVGLFGTSESNHGIRGSSNEGWGGYFTSSEGYGIVVSTGGSDHWDHAGTFDAQGGYAVYATSSGNMAIRGESGDTDGLWQPVGNVGVVGIGQSRGMYGSGGSSYGMYATSLDWYGVYGRTSRSDHNYGFYTPDNLYSQNINLSGAIMQVMENGGDEPLSPGDVVVFSGIAPSVSAIDGPIVQVARAGDANSTAVAGVVFSRYNINALDPDGKRFDDTAQGETVSTEVTPEGNASPGEYVLVVVQGPAQVKVSALNGGTIQPGDLLSTGGAGGVAAKAATVTIDGVEITVPGTIFAKALESVSDLQDMIYVYVTLH